MNAREVLHGELDRLEELVRVATAEALRMERERDLARREVDTLRAKIVTATAAGIGAARIGKEIAIRHEYDAWLSDLRDIEKQLMTLAGAVPGSPPEPAAEGPWAVDLLDCGRDDGVQVCATWAEADDFRQSYVAAAEGMQHCERQAIIHRAVAGTRLGYHDRAPYFAADPVVPGSPETRQEEQR